MTTIINTPPNTSDDSSAGMLIGIVLGVLIFVLLLIFGIPYLRNRTSLTTPEPANGVTNVSVTVPSVPSTDNTGTTN